MNEKEKAIFLEEEEAIEKLVKDFAARMRIKLLEKLLKGWGGWNDPVGFPTKILEDKLKAHIERGFDIKNMVDIGNFALLKGLPYNTMIACKETNHVVFYDKGV